MVSVSPAIPVTRTTSAFAGVGRTPTAQIVALNGTAGKREPSPLATTSDVPDAAGLGAVATRLYARFLCASNGTSVAHRDVTIRGRHDIIGHVFRRCREHVCPV